MQRRFTLGLLAALPFAVPTSLAAQNTGSSLLELYISQNDQLWKTINGYVGRTDWYTTPAFFTQNMQDFGLYLTFIEGNFGSFGATELVGSLYHVITIRVVAQDIADNPNASEDQRTEAAEIVTRAEILEAKIRERLREPFGVTDPDNYKPQDRKLLDFVSPIIARRPKDTR